LIGLGAGSMLSVSLVHIFPESIEQTEYAAYAFILGFLVIYLIEEILTPHAHDHAHEDHAHEDPHEHYDHVAMVSYIAIFIHTLFDWLGIRAGFGVSSEVGYAVLIGVALHQIPVSLSLAAIFRESKFRKNIQIVLLSFFALAAPIGFIVSDFILQNISEMYTGLAMAFAGWSLLYVASADLLPVIHSQSKNKYRTVLLFIVGAIAVSAIRLYE
jgi:zinc transporter ZupT